MSLFGKNYEEFGSSNNDLILKTRGKIKIQWGNKLIDLLDKNGNLNVPKSETITSVSSESLITGNGIYKTRNKVIASIGGSQIDLTSLANWDLTDSTKLDYIKNKPTKLSYFINDIISENLLSKLSNLPSYSELQRLLNTKQENLTFDNIPINNSSNPVKSKGIYNAIKQEEERAERIEQNLSLDILAINEKIPIEATSSNQLSDKNWVNTEIGNVTGNSNKTIAILDELITGLSGRIGDLETSVGNTSVSTLIDNKINFLDSTKSLVAGADGLALQITQVNGLITEISGSIASNIYEPYGTLSSLKGTANGVAELDEYGIILSSQLPSYVDDVIEGYYYNNKLYKESSHITEISGESGKIYIDLHTEKTYRWGGSSFAVISETLALGETSSTAYRGDRGKIAYNHSQTAHAPSNAEVNQNAFSNIIIGNTTIAANSKTDTFTLKAGTNITLTPNNKEITITASDTWRPLGTGATDACAGNDSRLSDSRPASDVYSWAKASTKPSYSYNEISGTPSSLPASDVYDWAKASTKPTYTLDEISDGSTRKLASYLPLIGGTITGNLTYKAPHDLTAANNGVNLTSYYTTFTIFDKNNNISVKLENIVETNRNGFFLYARSYDTSGTLKALRGIKYMLLKPDNNDVVTGTWTIDDAASFRTALGLGTNATSSTSYLPLTGGTLSLSGVDSLTIKKTTNLYSYIKFNGLKNNADTAFGYLGFNDTGIPAYRDLSGNAYPLLHSNNYANYAVKLTGGSIITGEGADLLTINRTSTVDTTPWIRFYSLGSLVGYLGVGADKNPKFYYDSNNGGILYHSGNLPAYPTKASWNYDDVYLKLTGGDLTGDVNDKLNVVRGTTPSANTYRGHYFYDKNSKRLAQVEYKYSNSGRNQLNLYILSNYSSEIYGGISIYKDINESSNSNYVLNYNAKDGILHPNTNFTLDIGSSDYWFNNSFIKNIFARSVGLSYDVDTSRVYSYNFLNTSGNVMASISYHNVGENIILNPIGSNSVWSDAVGKYSLFVGNNLLTYNTYPIFYSDKVFPLRENNSKNLMAAGLSITSPCYGNTASDLISGIVGNLSYGDAGPQIRFDDSNNLCGALLFTSHDACGSGASLHFVTNLGDSNFHAKRFVADATVTIGYKSENAYLPNANANLYVGGTSIFTSDTSVVFYGIDASKADNNLSNTLYPGFRIKDKNGKIIGQYLSIVEANGNIRSWISTKLYNTSGELIADIGIGIQVAKNGTATWFVGAPDKFRSALGLSSLATDTTSYLPRDGSTSMSGELTSCGARPWKFGGNTDSTVSLSIGYIKATSNSKTFKFLSYLGSVGYDITFSGEDANTTTNSTCVHNFYGPVYVQNNASGKSVGNIYVNGNIVALKNLVIKKDTNTTISFIDNKYLTTSGTSIGSEVSENNWTYTKFSVEKGDKFLIRGVGGTSPRLWAFTDSNNIIKLAAAAGTSLSSYAEITANLGGYLVVNFNKTAANGYSLVPISWISGFLNKSGGTIENYLNINFKNKTKLQFSINSEGGNIRIYSPDNYTYYLNENGSIADHFWEIDAYNGDLRFYNFTGGDSTTASVYKDIVFTKDGYVKATMFLGTLMGAVYGKTYGYLETPYNVTARLTSLNLDFNAEGSTGKALMRVDIAGSTTITDTSCPPVDISTKSSAGYVLSFGWDGASSHTVSLLFIPNGDHIGNTNGPLHCSVRGLDNGTWTDWRRLAYVDDIFETNFTSTVNRFKFTSESKKIENITALNAWSSWVYSTYGFNHSFVLSFKIGQTNKPIMIGLDSSPSITETDWKTLDYGWYLKSGGDMDIRESGSSLSSITGHTTYSAGDEFRIEYTAWSIRYYHNNVLCRAVTRIVSGKLHFTATFLAGGYIYDVSFNTTSYTASNADLLDGYNHSDFLKITGGTSSGTIISTASPGFASDVAANSWAYVRLKSGTDTEWHIGTNSDSSLTFIGQAGAFEIRDAKSSHSGISIRHNTSSFGKLVVTVPSGECSIGLRSAAAGSTSPQWVFGIMNQTNYRFGFYNKSGNAWKANFSQNGYLYLGDGDIGAAERLDIDGNSRIRGNNLYLGTGTGNLCHMLYDNTNKCLKFIFD